MRRVFDIQVQKLFAVVLAGKVLSSGLGWYFQYPWSLGFWLPLALMGGYIWLGLRRPGTDVSDEKFADSCYYLGFIFTITSIIFSLFDLPNIGSRIQDIAVRFGAGMVSTVLGLSVRVYLVSFKRDLSDAMQDAEDGVLDATKKLREQMVMALEKLREFQAEVGTASQATVQHVNQQMARLSQDHATGLTAFYKDLSLRNKETFTEALDEVVNASLRLSDTVDGYAKGLKNNLDSVQKSVLGFTDAITQRLQTTSFPDDFFARQLAPPLQQLQHSAGVLAGGFMQASDQVGRSSAALDTKLQALSAKARVAEGGLDAVLRLAQQQQAVLDSAQGQLSTLGQLTSTLARLDSALGGALQGIQSSHAVTSHLSAQVAALVAESGRGSLRQQDALAAVVNRLDVQAAATGQVATSLSHAVAARDAATEMMAANAAAFEKVANKLDAVAAADAQSSQVLVLLGKQAGSAIGKVDSAAGQLQNMVWRLATLDAALRAQSEELHQVAERLGSGKGAKPTGA